MPEAITYTEARQNFASVMDRVCDDHEPVIVTRQKSRPVVLMSLEDYNSMVETAYLLSTPANAERLMASVREADAGLAQEREIANSEQLHGASQDRLHHLRLGRLPALADAGRQDAQ